MKYRIDIGWGLIGDVSRTPQSSGRFRTPKVNIRRRNEMARTIALCLGDNSYIVSMCVSLASSYLSGLYEV